MQLPFHSFTPISRRYLRIMHSETSKLPVEKLVPFVLTRGSSFAWETAGERGESVDKARGGKLICLPAVENAVSEYRARETISPIKIAITFLRDR